MENLNEKNIISMNDKLLRELSKEDLIDIIKKSIEIIGNDNEIIKDATEIIQTQYKEIDSFMKFFDENLEIKKAYDDFKEKQQENTNENKGTKIDLD